MNSGYFEIGIFSPKTHENIGTLWRSAYQLGASGIFTIGHRYKKQSSDTVGAISKIPLRNYARMDDFYKSLPYGAMLVGVEMGGTPLQEFNHPLKAVYLLGREDSGMSKEARAMCHLIVSIESVRSLSYNVAVAGSLVMYHRLTHIPRP